MSANPSQTGSPALTAPADLAFGKLGIERFRGIREGVLEGFAAVNLLIGPNGCGKSTVLEAAYLLASAFSDEEPFRRYSSRGSHNSRRRFVAAKRNEETVGADEWWYQYDTEQPIAIHGRCWGLEAVARLERGGSLAATPVGEPADGLARRFSRALLIESGAIASREVEQAFFDEVNKHRLDKALVGHMNAMYGFSLEDFTYSAQTNRLMCKFPSLTLPLDSLGAGMRIALRVLLVALAGRDSVLLLEEFDVFQHKGSIAALARVVCQVAAERKVQILMTTHSDETLAAFVHAATSTEGGGDVVRVFPLTLDASGKLQARALDAPTVKTLIEGGADLRDIKRYAS